MGCLEQSDSLKQKKPEWWLAWAGEGGGEGREVFEGIVLAPQDENVPETSHNDVNAHDPTEPCTESGRDGKFYLVRFQHSNVYHFLIIKITLKNEQENESPLLGLRSCFPFRWPLLSKCLFSL